VKLTQAIRLRQKPCGAEVKTSGSTDWSFIPVTSPDELRRLMEICPAGQRDWGMK